MCLSIAHFSSRKPSCCETVSNNWPLCEGFGRTRFLSGPEGPGSKSISPTRRRSWQRPKSSGPIHRRQCKLPKTRTRHSECGARPKGKRSVASTRSWHRITTAVLSSKIVPAAERTTRVRDRPPQPIPARQRRHVRTPTRKPRVPMSTRQLRLPLHVRRQLWGTCARRMADSHQQRSL